MPVRSELQIADMFTKQLPTSKLIPFMSKVSLKSIYSSDKEKAWGGILDDYKYVEE